MKRTKTVGILTSLVLGALLILGPLPVADAVCPGTFCGTTVFCDGPDEIIILNFCVSCNCGPPSECACLPGGVVINEGACA